MNGLSIVIPSKTLSNLTACVAAIREAGETCRIVVVDDSETGFPPMEGVEFVKGKRPFSFSANVNAGINATGADDVVILNDDAILKTERGFTRLKQAADANPEFGVIASTTNVVGNRNQLPHNTGELREEPRCLCFVCVLVPRRTIEKVGLLDEDFTSYACQDDDYSLRVRRDGMKLGILDSCYVDHGSLVSTFRGPGGPGAPLAPGIEIFTKKWGKHPL